MIDGRLRKESAQMRVDYKFYNEYYFSNKLPRDMFLFWEDKPFSGRKRRSYLGCFYEPKQCSEWQWFPAIAVASHLRAHNLYLGTLLHEMIHASGRLGHGSRFDRERMRLLRRRSIRDLVM